MTRPVAGPGYAAPRRETGAIGRAGRAGLTIAALVAIMWVLAVPAAHVLPAPVSAAPAQWRAWLARTEPTVAVFSVLRLGALLVALVETAVVVVVTLTSAGRLAPGLHALLPRPLVGVAVLLLGAAAAGCSRPVVVPDPSIGPGPPPTVTISAAAPTPAPVVSAPAPPRGPSPPPAPPSSAPGPVTAAPAGPAHVSVRPGDSMWLIAERMVREAGGDPADTPVVGAYWVRLLRANPLPDPSLVFTGQILVVPPFGQEGE